MTTVFYRSPSSLFLLMAGLVLGGVLALELRRDMPTTVAPTSAPPAAPGAAVEVDMGSYVAPPIEDYDEVLVRPLFVEGRTPPEPSAPAEESVTSKSQEGLAKFWKLEGLVLTPEARVALVRGKRDRKLLRLTEGEVFEGWEVVEFAPERILLKKGKKSEELELKTAIGPAVRRAETKRRPRKRPQPARKTEPTTTARPAKGS